VQAIQALPMVMSSVPTGWVLPRVRIRLQRAP
jgi:hypothetical protein